MSFLQKNKNCDVKKFTSLKEKKILANLQIYSSSLCVSLLRVIIICLHDKNPKFRENHKKRQKLLTSSSHGKTFEIYHK